MATANVDIQRQLVTHNPRGAFINYERGGRIGDLRVGPENFLHRKGGDLKCFQNSEART